MKHIVCLFVLLSLPACAQVSHKEIPGQYGDKNILQVADKIFSKEDFKRALGKAQHGKQFTEKDVRDYLELYITLQLKVKDAENSGYMESPKFLQELEGYAKQIKQGLAKSKTNIEPLVQEAYQRKQTLLRVAHILVKVNENAAPSDTMEARNKIIDIRNKIVYGMDFEKAAREFSDDPSVKDNAGDLGFFTVFSMVYSFESAAYNLKQNEVSQPVRTKFGYHIVKLLDRKPNPGEVRVRHIMLKVSDVRDEDATEQLAKDIYKKLMGGDAFEDFAKNYSDDKASAARSGELAAFGVGSSMPPEFEAASFGLRNPGDFTAPFKTKYGWHVVQLIEKKPIPSYEEIKTQLKEKVFKDSRSKIVPAPTDNSIENDPEYISQVSEYRDGILLFEATDKNVWSKAVKDVEGLKKFYEDNKYNYESFEKSKGKITSDYQNYLENEWIAGLRKKYQVVVNRQVLSEILSAL